MRTFKSTSLVSTSLLALFLVAGGAACASQDAEEDVTTQEPDGTGDPNPDPDPDPEVPPTPDPEPDPSPALPACPGADASYLIVAGDTEVVDYFGPNISVILSGDEVAVLYPSTDQYGTGSWDFPDASEWTAELCVDWNDNTASCESVLYPSTGSVQINVLDEDEALPTKVSGRFVTAIFVDDPANPTCQASLDLAFSAGL